MKHLLYLRIVLVIVLAATITIAQEKEKPAKPGTLVFSQNICPIENMPKLEAALDSIFAPILDKFIDEGKLFGWGVLTHAWGDEWNWNYYYIVENHRAFLDFFDEYVKRVQEQHPGLMNEIRPLITRHKDNIYSIEAMHMRKQN